MTRQDLEPVQSKSCVSSQEPLPVGPLSVEQLELIDRYWRAANYLSVGQIYLLDNPLLRRQLELSDVKPRLLGHWGTTPGLNFIYVHLNRLIRERNLDLLYITGPGHGGPALVANSYLEGTYSEVYPQISRDEIGLACLFKQFSFPGGIPSHVAPETPGSIHEGGELGYALVHAYGAVLDNPELIACCVIGDGEAETGPLAASWHSNKFLNPVTDGVVLPVLHLNGFKIANPTVLARIPKEELTALMVGYGHEPFFVEGDDPVTMHQRFAATLDEVSDRIASIKTRARAQVARGERVTRPSWPMIVLRTPKGWTGPKEVDGKKTEGSWRSHQVPLSGLASDPSHLALLENWLRSYKPEELFDRTGALLPELAALAPSGTKRMSANVHTNGGKLLTELELPPLERYETKLDANNSLAGSIIAENTRPLGAYLRDVLRLNDTKKNFRIFGPDETASNRLSAVFEASDKTFLGELLPDDDHLSPSGRVMEILSEHLCQGWLEGYLLTGRHGFFSCYEAFIHIVDSMFNQHAKWLKTTSEIPWRAPIASLNYLLSSHVWRQDHNGFSHQDPGFLDHVSNKKSSVVRLYLPPDANSLLVVADHCLRSKNYVNVIVAGKQPALQYLTLAQAREHCRVGLGVWDWASSDEGGEPDVVAACAGDVPTMEALAAVKLLRSLVPDARIRFVNVVDLMALQQPSEHPHGVTDEVFDRVFTADQPIIFAFHGYPVLIHRLTYRRRGHDNIHVRGYKEEGTTTTPFDMTVLNELDRYHLLVEMVRRSKRLAPHLERVRSFAEQKLSEHRAFIRERGEDMPEIAQWKWSS